MKLFGAVFFCAALATGMAIFAEDIQILPGTPFLDKPDLNANVLAVSRQELKLESLGYQRRYLDKNPAIKMEHHPLMVYLDFNQVKMADGRMAWVSEHAQYSQELGRLAPKTFPRQSDALLVFFSLIALTLWLWFGIKRGFFRGLFGPPGQTPGTVQAAYFVGLIVSVRYVLLSHVVFGSGNIMIYPMDEIGYFNIATDILSGQISKDWAYTIGLPLLYLPFLPLCGATNYFDIVGVFSLFSAYFIAPAGLAIGFYIVLKLTASVRKAFLAVLALSLLPFLYFPVEFHLVGADWGGFFKGIACLADYNQASYRLYYLFKAIGYNGMSDTSSTAIVLLCVLLCLRLKASAKTTMLIAALWGFACLLRISNVFFAPPIAFLVWSQSGEKARADRLFLVKTALAGAVTFLAVFGAQLLVNKTNHGGWLTFPYVSHPDRSAEGFTLAGMVTGVSYLVGCNYLPMVCGAVGLIFCRDRKLFQTLTLLAVPIVFFYCGYPVVGTSPIRFILTAYFPLMAALACADVWDGLSRRQGLVLAGALILNALLVAPCHRFSPPFVFNLDQLPNGSAIALALTVLTPIVSLIAVVATLRGSRRALAFAALWLALYNLGSPYAVFALLVGLLGVALALWFQEAARDFQAKNMNAATPQAH